MMNPLTGIYGAASGLRNRLYDRGFVRPHRLQRPVVSVGNLSTGGSGKTPFVIALGELLKARGIPFDVLSRGYRRKTRGVLVVEPGGSASDFGDEPLLIARRLGVPVIVGESRYEAGQLAEKRFETQLHILDDGFQHRSLARDFDIVLMTGQEFEDRLLPVGRLREPVSSLERADAIVLPAGVAVDQAKLRGKPVRRMKRDIVVDGASRSPVVFCGIAGPAQFFAQVRSAGIVPAAEIAFRDHYSYRRRDVKRLKAAQAKSSAGGFLSTEKDMVNLGPLADELKPISVAKLNLSIEQPDDIVDTILARIRK
ncbi:MAG TPA: tetraacyldisaccharide 4'-kinase [Terriglobales bacterium]|nr:tetraacyldisaccharide 4'-kinase [Terriglobales bacterium]